MTFVKNEIVINLSRSELQMVNDVCAKFDESVKTNKHKPTFIHPYAPRATKVGIMAEVAFAQWSLFDYEYVRYQSQTDDVLGYQIKATERVDGSLIKQPHNPSGIYVLGIVNTTLNEVAFKGWMSSKEIQQECYWRSNVPKPGFFVPQSELWSMSELTETKELAAHRGAF